jgi:hypothetical protein
MNDFFTKIARRQFCRVVFVAGFFTMAEAAAMAADTNHPVEQYVEGEVIVTFNPGYSLATAKQAVTTRGMEFSQRLSGLPQTRGKEFGLVRNKNRKTADLINELKQDPTVESAEPNYLRWVNAVPATRTGIFTNLLGLQNNGQGY